MPILQHKLVMKSIEALHDEALLLVPDAARNRGVSAPPAFLHAKTPPQESPIDTSADVPPGSTSDHDIMARIDRLIKKLDEDDDVAITLIVGEGAQSNAGNMTDDSGDTATADNIAIDNLANPESSILATAADHANENAILDVAVDSMVEKIPDKSFSKTVDNASDDTSDEILADDQPGETAPPDQMHALADIATAIYQARQQAVDTVIADASQNNTVPFDMDVLSAAVADEVRRTVSAVMTAELPKMVRDAVGEAIRALPANSTGQPTLATGNQPKTKSVPARNTTAAKKALAKKTASKKAGTKKPAAKKSISKKAPAKKTTTST